MKDDKRKVEMLKLHIDFLERLTMIQRKLSRRAFMERSALALGASSIPLDAFAQTLMVRPEWQAFKTTPRYDSLLRAIRLMKANNNAADPNSWTYWMNIHVYRCPHSVPYFFAWHRGYLYHFERRLRAISGDSQLVLPYWDYYSYSTLPAEFTNPNGGNPLYADRMNTNVWPALSMAPFGSNVTNFPRGASNAFETLCEDAPHNRVHEIIGSVMVTMQSPLDPIFWLHHANIDRLWVAWVSAGLGRKMPPTTDPYWSGTHIYNSSLSMARGATYSTRTNLGYRYANESLPSRLPLSQIGDSNIRRVGGVPANMSVSIPAIGSYRLSGPRATGKHTFSVSGASNIGLAENSVGVQLPASSEHARVLADIGAGKSGRIPGRPEEYRSVLITLDSIELQKLAKQGGYFYELYLNIPPAAGAGIPAQPKSISIGTLGAFRINAAAHHADGSVQLQYPIRRALAGASPEELSKLSVSFVRVSGARSPKGGLIGLGEVRLEVSTEDVD